MMPERNALLELAQVGGIQPRHKLGLADQQNL